MVTEQILPKLGIYRSLLNQRQCQRVLFAGTRQNVKSYLGHLGGGEKKEKGQNIKKTKPKPQGSAVNFFKFQ